MSDRRFHKGGLTIPERQAAFDVKELIKPQITHLTTHDVFWILNECGMDQDQAVQRILKDHGGGLPIQIQNRVPHIGTFNPSEKSSNVTGCDNSTSPTPESSPGNDEAVNSSNQSAPLTEHGGHLDHAHSSSYLIKKAPASEGISIIGDDSKIEQPKQESGQDISISSPQNLTPQGQHLTFPQTQAAHGAFPGIYQSGRTVASPSTLLQQSIDVAGPVETADPPPGSYKQLPPSPNNRVSSF